MAERDIDGRRMETSIRIRTDSEGEGGNLSMTDEDSIYPRDGDNDQDNGPFTWNLERETRFP